jgi:phosphatidylserine/phosphatidylglycerophosphate/cardiolipin synthase-like enzyme
MPAVFKTARQRLISISSRNIIDPAKDFKYLRFKPLRKHSMRSIFTSFFILFLTLTPYASKTTSLLIFPKQGSILTRDTLVKGIQQAKQTIQLACPTLTEPVLISALKEAATKGVSVHIMVDKPSQNKKILSLKLKNFHVKSVSGLNADFSKIHQKFFILDGHMSLILTGNLTKESLIPGASKKFPSGYRSFGYVVHAPAVVQEMARVFQADWKKERIVPRGGSIVWGPGNQRSQILGKIRLAQKSIHLYACDLTDRGIRLALEQALRHKIKVNILTVPYTFSDTRDQNKYALTLLKRKGATIKYFPNDIKRNAKKKRNRYGLEGTSILIDKDTLLIHSCELGINSLDSQREFGIFTRNSTSISEFMKIFDHDWKKSLTSS